MTVSCGGLLVHGDPGEDEDDVLISPITLACVSGHFEIVDLLKKHNGERDESDPPFTIMHTAARVGWSDCVRLHGRGYAHYLRQRREDERGDF
ncbi:unnamed protein product [Fusarium graminearum]|nr:unnamed protein product [Fusarium graminearum]